MVRVGMDVDLVEEKGRALKADAEKLSQLIRQLEGTVRRLPSVWDGKDARDFVTTWWPQHKQSLQQSVDAVSGLGQSALNNAAEQREVSGSTGGSAGGGGPWQVGNTHGSSAGGVLPDLAAGGSDSLLAIYDASRGNVNLLDHNASASFDGYTASASGSTTLVDGVVAAGGATVTVMAASASASSSLKLVNGMPVGQARASAEADLLDASAHGSIKAGNATLEGQASAKVSASGTAGVSVDEHGVKADAGIKLEAAASASASAGMDIGGIEPKVTGKVYAGVSLTAEASAQVSDEYVGAHVSLGASLGIGAGIEFDVGIHPAEIAKTYDNVMNAITSFKLW